MNFELKDILDRGLSISEKYSGGEFMGVNWKWRETLEENLLAYFERTQNKEE